MQLTVQMTPPGTQPSPSSRTAVVVLGMHRSGTSALTGILAKLGYAAPATELEERQDNARGYFESRKIYGFHTKLLTALGTRWDDWTAINPDFITTAEGVAFHQSALDILLEEFGEAPHLVLKDPRICRLLPFWRSVLDAAGCAPVIVHTHRNPLEVAASLGKRDGLSQQVALLIWLRHVLEAEHASRGLPRAFTSYDRLLDNWPEMVAQVQRQLGITLPLDQGEAAAEIEDFLSSDLQHFKEPQDGLAADLGDASWVGTAYEVLQRWAASGEDSDGRATFDRLRGNLNAALVAFGDLIDRTAETSGDPDESGQSAANLGAEVALLTGQLRATRTALKKHQHDEAKAAHAIHQAEKECAERDGQIAAMTDRLETAEAELKTRLQELTTMTIAMIAKEQDIDGHRERLSALEADQARQADHLAASHREIAALRASTSWAVTRPLRWLKTAVGRR